MTAHRAFHGVTGSRLVAATANPGKLREFEQMLGPLGIEIVPQSQLGIPETDEPHSTFVENALAKARHASRLSGMPAFADDSGVCVAALGGRPGVRSARYAQAPAAATREQQDRCNNEKLMAELARERDRSAHYYCVIVLSRHPADPQPLIADGSWHGEILGEPRGTGGFGYDPYFYVRALGRTAAELDPDEKNAISHRGQALKALAARLERGEAGA